MANHYLRNSDSTRIYRIVYDTDTETGYISAGAAYVCATGTSAVLPNGTPVDKMDMQVDISQVLVDSVVNGLVDSNVTAYRTLAKAMVDASW